MLRVYKSIAVLIVTTLAHAQVEIDLELVVDGLSRPILATHAGDGSGRLFIVEQGGRIRILDRDGNLLPEDFLHAGSGGLNLITRSGNEQGLLGLAFHPDYAANGRFYINYTRRSDGDTIVAEYTVSENPNIANTDGETILGPIAQPQSNHNGGHLAFGPDGYLYIGAGDGGAGGDTGTGHTSGTGNAQDITNNLLGKILDDIDRTQPPRNYAIPDDNPLLGAEGDDEIFSYGLRNPWRFSFDRGTGRIFCGDVGQNRLEEIDIIESGGNYGWRLMEGSDCFNPSSGCESDGLQRPIHEYGRSDGNSVTGGYVYRGRASQALRGLYLFADFGSGRIWSLEETSPGVWDHRELLDSALFISSFGEDEAGEMYVCSFGGGGAGAAVYRILGPSNVGDWNRY